MRLRTIRAKIQVAFGLALVAFAVALVTGIVQLRDLRAELARANDHYIPLSFLIGQMETLSSGRQDFEQLFNQDNPKVLQAMAFFKNRAMMQRPMRGALELVERADESAPTGMERAELDKVRGHLKSVSQLADSHHDAVDLFLTAVATRDRDVALERYQESESARLALRTEIGALSKAADDAARGAVTAARDHAGRVFVILVLLSVFAVLFGLIAAGLTARMLQPMGDLAERARIIGQGDFGDEVKVRPGAGEEIATLAHEFNQMIQRLRARDESLRALSAHLESILEGIRSGLVVLNPAGRITRVNRAAEEIWGVSRQGLIDQGIEALPGYESFADRVERVRSTGKPARIAAVPVERSIASSLGAAAAEAALDEAAAPVRLVDITLIPFEDGVIVVGDDVTERTTMERALLRSEKLAAIGRMSSQITHEVRNPLNSLSLNLELLEDELKGFKDANTEEAWRIVKALAGEADRLNEVTEGYLGFARLPRPRLVKEDLNAVVGGLLDFMREEVASAGVTLTTELVDELPSVLADENQIRQALLNIIRNGVEAMAGGADKALAISTRVGGDGVEIVIADTGPGIDVRSLGRIFDPFYSTKDSGTGVGLPLTQQIIEEHGGTVTCESEKGRGTTFIVRLPKA